MKLTPDDPTGLILLAFLQMMNNQPGPSKETLHKATRLARKLGDPALLAEIEELRQTLSNPMFSLLGPMLPNFLDAMDAEDEDFFL
jgi:hypothetical protein